MLAITLASLALSSLSLTSASPVAVEKVKTVPASKYMPAGGVDTTPSAPPPVYHVSSDFDRESFQLALHQEWIELDLFHNGLAKFSAADFEAAGITGDYQFLIEFMADQEVGHATLLSNIIGKGAAKQCTYEYPFQTVPEFIDFCQKLTRFGESGVYGFLAHLNSRPSATLLTQSITTEARQQMIFRQMEGAFPMPVYFEAGIPQSWGWTLLAPYIKSCPKENTPLDWQNFPALNITNNPSIIALNNTAAISTNGTNLSAPGDVLHFTWETPGKEVGPYGQKTSVSTSKPAKFAMFVSQLNVTYTELEGINGTSAYTKQPGGVVFPNTPDGIVNGTMFVALTSSNPHLTSYNLSLINPYVVAGPALYQSG